MPSLRRAVLATTAVLAAAVTAVPAHAQSESASFAQLDGPAGCVVATGSEVEGPPCTRARALLTPAAIVVSPDQRHVVVASGGPLRGGSHALTVLRRDTDTGALTFASCVSDSGGDGRVGTDGLCADGDALRGANDLAFSPDGRFVYATARHASSVTWLRLDPESGRLTQAGCARSVPVEDRCSDVPSLGGAGGVAVSPDGAHVYVTAAGTGAITAFVRDRDTGALGLVGCVSDTGSDGICQDGTGLDGASSVLVAPDGRHVYVTAAGVGAVTAYSRDPATGALRPAGCLLDRAPAGGPCRSTPPLDGAAHAAITPDGEQLLVAATGDSAVAIIERDPDTGALAPGRCFVHAPPAGDDAVEEDDDEEGDEDEGSEDEEDEEDVAATARRVSTERCRPARALDEVDRVVVSADGRGVFASSPGDYLAAFGRDPSSNDVQQFGCAEEQQTYRACTRGRLLFDTQALAASADARSLYVATDNGISVFAAAVAVTSRSATARRDGTFRVRVACPAARRRACVGRLSVVRPGVRSVTRTYRLAPGGARHVRLRLQSRTRRALRARRALAVTLVAADARRSTWPVRKRVVVRAG